RVGQPWLSVVRVDALAVVDQLQPFGDPARCQVARRDPGDDRDGVVGTVRRLDGCCTDLRGVALSPVLKGDPVREVPAAAGVTLDPAHADDLAGAAQPYGPVALPVRLPPGGCAVDEG